MPKPTNENKAMFVAALQAAFISGDPERYGHLQRDPIEYKVVREVVREVEIEYLMRSGSNLDPQVLNVTGCSCTALAEEIIKRFL